MNLIPCFSSSLHPSSSDFSAESLLLLVTVLRCPEHTGMCGLPSAGVWLAWLWLPVSTGYCRLGTSAKRLGLPKGHDQPSLGVWQGGHLVRGRILSLATSTPVESSSRQKPHMYSKDYAPVDSTDTSKAVWGAMEARVGCPWPSLTPVYASSLSSSPPHPENSCKVFSASCV